ASGGPPAPGRGVAAPFTKWGPGLFGLPQPASWPIHPPFDTSARTVQPTEQCGQIFLRIVAPATLGPAASAFCTLASGNAPIVARPPATRPERRRKLRRSRPTPD